MDINIVTTSCFLCCAVLCCRIAMHFHVALARITQVFCKTMSPFLSGKSFSMSAYHFIQRLKAKRKHECLLPFLSSLKIYRFVMVAVFSVKVSSADFSHVSSIDNCLISALTHSLFYHIDSQNETFTLSFKIFTLFLISTIMAYYDPGKGFPSAKKCSMKLFAKNRIVSSNHRVSKWYRRIEQFH